MDLEGTLVLPDALSRRWPMQRWGLVALAAVSVLLLGSCSSTDSTTDAAAATSPPSLAGGVDCTLVLRYRGSSYVPLPGVDAIEDIRALVDRSSPAGSAFAERCNGQVSRGARLDVWAVRGAEPTIAVGYVLPAEGGVEGGGIYVNEEVDEDDWPTFDPATGQLE
jgi:hypothetical protein